MRSVLLALLMVCSSAAFAQDWPGWRGEGGGGVYGGGKLPLKWSKEENILWKITPAGWGDSSPVIVGDRLFLTAQTDDDGLWVMALARDTGKVLWSTEVGKGRLKAHDLHNMATPTPVADGDRVWALFGTGDLVCLDHEGKVLWRRQIQDDHGKYSILWGMGTSPVLHEDRLFITTLHNGPSYLLAVDALTGKDIWKAERDLGAQGEARDSYSTPILVPTQSGFELVVAGGDHVDAYDPVTGKRTWVSGGLAVPHPYGRTIAGPAAGGGVVVAVASGFRNQGFMVALRKGGRGDVTESHRLWKAERYSPDCPTPLIYEGYVFAVRDDGMASCLELKTGEVKWQERLFSANVKVSPVAGYGRVYFLSGRAQCKVVKAGPEYEVMAVNEINEDTISTPALSDGKIFIRTKEHLYAVGE